MDHMGSKSRSLVQFLERACVHSRRHGFDLVFMSSSKNVDLNEI